MTPQLVVTCEHGGNRVPAKWQPKFAGQESLLESHRGYDPGALELARELAEHFAAPLYFSQTTRLLVELNRSPHHPQLFSAITQTCTPEQRAELLREHYLPYREAVENTVAAAVAAGRTVTHLSVHTFTPELDGEVRTADVGLLYDPARPGERELCQRWQKLLAEEMVELRVRRNYPYLGTADGFTTHLRKRFAPQQYRGVELEVNQQWLKNRPGWQRLRAGIIATFAAAWR